MSIAVFLHLKGLSAKGVRIDLVQVLRSDAIADSTGAKYIRRDVILHNEPEAENSAENQGFSIPDNSILEAIEMMRFAFIRQIVKVTFIHLNSVFSRSTKSLHFILKGQRSVPRRLSDLQKQALVIMSKKLLKRLESLTHHS
jgi:hypothetical protein